MQDIEEADLGRRWLSALSSNEEGRAGTRLMGPWPADKKFMSGVVDRESHRKQADQFPHFP